MEMNKVETQALQQTAKEAVVTQLSELNDLQLALVGGGGGDVVFA